MPSSADIEAYLIRSNLRYSSVGEDAHDSEEKTWLISAGTEGSNVVLRLDGPLLLFRVKVFELNDVAKKAELFARLLELNASDMVHGAYGVANEAVVLTAGLRLEHLDYSEFQGTMDDITMALTNHYKELSEYRAN